MTARRHLLALALPTVLGALPAAAECAVFVRPVFVPFTDLTLPENAELRVIAGDFSGATLIPDGGDEVSLQILRDDIGERLDLPAELTPLPAGGYTLRLDQEHHFTMGTDVDTTAPAAPVVTAEYVPDAAFPLPTFSKCGSDGNNPRSLFTVDGTELGDVVLVNGAVVAAGSSGTTSFDVPALDGEVEVVVRDVAGNDSPPTLLDVESGGCGCSTSSPAGPFSAALALLLLGARRKRR